MFEKGHVYVGVPPLYKVRHATTPPYHTRGLHTSHCWGYEGAGGSRPFLQIHIL